MKLKDVIRNQKNDLDCSKIPSVKEFDFHNRKSGYLKDIFTNLDSISVHSLYWFEIVQPNKSKEIKKTFADYKLRKAEHGRTVPASNKTETSKILYVGIRRGGVRKRDGFTNIGTRVFQHLGYYSKVSTQALQLARWCNEKLVLNVLPLPEVTKEYLNILEKLLAIELKPIVGKH